MLWGYEQVASFQELVVKGYASTVFGMNECVFPRYPCFPFLPAP